MIDYPVRVNSANGQPPNDSEFARSCQTCGASFLKLAAGRTGVRGVWSPTMLWYCSLECAPQELREAHDQERRALE